MQDLAAVPELGSHGAFQEVTLPGGATKVVTLPRWNVVALARRPAVLYVSDVTSIPELSRVRSFSLQSSCNALA